MIKTAILVNKAEQLAMGIPIDGLLSEKVLDVIADPDTIKISVMISNIFFIQTFILFLKRFVISFKRF